MRVFIYRTYHRSFNQTWRFTVLLGEIGHQHVKAPLAAAISPYFDPKCVKDGPQTPGVTPLLFTNSVWVL